MECTSERMMTTPAGPHMDFNRSNMTMVRPSLSFDHLFLGVVIFVGIPGNLITILILTVSHRLRRSPTSVYLAFLAASDSLFLASMCVLWMMATIRNMVQSISDQDLSLLCKLVTYLCNVTGCTSTWLVVAFTIERYFVVVHPLHRLAQCSKRNARRNIFMILPWPLLMYSYSFVIVGSVHRRCSILPGYSLHAVVLHVVDIFIVLLVPFCIIVTANVRIGHTMMNSRAKGPLSGKLASPGTHLPLGTLPRRDSKSNLFQRINTTLAIRKRIKDMKTTRMLVIISVAFVCLNSPHNFFRIWEMVSLLLKGRPTRAERKLSSIFMALYYLNFAVNFMLYSVVSSNFRSAAKQCIFHCGAPSAETTTGENVSAAVILSAQFADNMVTVVRSQVRTQGRSASSGPGAPLSPSPVYTPSISPASGHSSYIDKKISTEESALLPEKRGSVVRLRETSKGTLEIVSPTGAKQVDDFDPVFDFA